jgi:hypothetical protein
MLWRISPRSRRSKPAGFILPAQPTLVARPPAGPDWIHEVRHDGYRLIARTELQCQPLDDSAAFSAKDCNMESTEARRRNDDTIGILHDFREIIAEAQRHGLPSLFEETNSGGTFRAEMGGTTIEGKISARHAIHQLRDDGILSPHLSRLSELFTDVIEEVAPRRNFHDFSATEIARVARSFNDRKFGQ